MKAIRLLVVAAALSASGLAQMTTDQKIADFTNMSQFYVRHYTPANWKIEQFRFDLREIGPWLTRVRATQNDLDYFDLCIEYLASLKDGHISYNMTSSYQAYLLFDVDIYDGKTLIEFISTRFPRDRFPIAIGDEVVSVDDAPVERLIQRFLKYGESANVRATRRRAADFITFRPQSVIPQAPEQTKNETAKVVIRKADGQEFTYDIPWSKSGRAVTNLAPTTGPFRMADRGKRAVSFVRDRSERYAELAQAWGVWTGDRMQYPQDALTEAERIARADQMGELAPEQIALTALGQLTPLYNPPPGFRLRLGSRPGDLFLSGTFPVGTQTVGWIRIPSFSPSSTTVALQQFRQEIIDLQQATSGLVIDVMHNPGGNLCYGQELLRYLIPQPFWGVGYWMKPTQLWRSSFESRRTNAPTAPSQGWERTLLALYDDLMAAAYASGDEVGVFPICSSSLTALPQDVVYTKPIMMLTNEFSVSAGDTFPALFQDARRGTLVGFRTGGLGGNVNSFFTTSISEASLSITRSLIVRERPVNSPEHGMTRFVENAGVQPDVTLDIMTRENLLTGGTPFVTAWIAEMRKLLPQ